MYVEIYFKSKGENVKLFSLKIKVILSYVIGNIIHVNSIKLFITLDNFI